MQEVNWHYRVKLHGHNLRHQANITHSLYASNTDGAIKACPEPALEPQRAGLRLRRSPRKRGTKEGSIIMQLYALSFSFSSFGWVVGTWAVGTDIFPVLSLPALPIIFLLFSYIKHGQHTGS